MNDHNNDNAKRLGDAALRLHAAQGRLVELRGALADARVEHMEASNVYRAALRAFEDASEFAPEAS